MLISPNERFKLVVAVHFVLMRGDQVLLGKRQNTGWSDGLFHLMAGHIEYGEMALDTLLREAKEELGIKVDLGKTQLKHVRNIVRPDQARLHLYFVITQWTGEPTIMEPELCSEIKWFDINQIPSKITRDTEETLGFIQQGIPFHETKDNE